MSTFLPQNSEYHVFKFTILVLSLTVPGVLDLGLPGHSRHVQQHLQPRRDFVLAICYTRFDGRRPGVRPTVTMRVADSS